MVAALELTGQKRGKLTAIADVGVDKHGKRIWSFQCDCGNQHRAVGSMFVRGQVQSCGCVKPAIARANGKRGASKVAASKARHGHSRAKSGEYIPEYGVWKSMRQRCSNPNNRDYPAYGGRGIRVCARWSRFDAFLADMGRRPSDSHSIDRIDPDGNYEPTNCRWADDFEQAANRRTRGTGEYANKENESGNFA